MDNTKRALRPAKEMRMIHSGDIMVVEDDPNSLKMVADMLIAEGYKVRAALSSKQALKSAFANPPNLILLDVKMPGMDGFEMCQMLKQDERTAECPIIFVSGLQAIADKVRGFQVGGVDFITKPLQREEVLARVSVQLELSRTRQQLEEHTRELSAANLKLQELDKLKNMFIASMSHELRTPMNSIIGFTGVMLQGLTGELNEKQKDFLSRVSNSGKHLLDLITGVIDISKIETGQLVVSPQHFSLKEVIDEAIGSTQPQANKKQLQLKVDASNWPEIYTDYHRLLQCLLNYLSNAVKFTEQGTVTVVIRERGSDVEIAVQDTGIGIAEADIPKLFKAFERLESHLKIIAGGTGLGLYLTKKIVTDLLQGTVAVDSQVGEGSTFFIRIPKELQVNTVQAEETKK